MNQELPYKVSWSPRLQQGKEREMLWTGNSLAFMQSEDLNHMWVIIPHLPWKMTAGCSTAALAHALLTTLLHLEQIKTPWSKGVIFSCGCVCFKSHLLQPWGYRGNGSFWVGLYLLNTQPAARPIGSFGRKWKGSKEQDWKQAENDSKVPGRMLKIGQHFTSLKNLYLKLAFC